MSWLRIDDGFGEHEKIIELSDRSFRLHVVALGYCARNLTDGKLTARRVAAVRAITDAQPEHLAELVHAGLWTEREGVYQIRDFLDYNPTAEEVKKRRKERSEAGKRGADSRWNGNSDNNGDGNSHSEPHIHPVIPRPVPSPTRTEPQDPKTIVRMEEVRLVTEAWMANAPPLIVHRSASLSDQRTVTAVAVRLRVYPVEVVVEAVANYAAVLGGAEYRWDHSWTIRDFLQRGLDKFVPEADPLENFRVRANGNGRPSASEIVKKSAERWCQEVEA